MQLDGGGHQWSPTSNVSLSEAYSGMYKWLWKGDGMKELSLKEVLKEKLEKLAEVELKNANCPIMFGEVEIPACIKEEMDK